MQQKKTWLKRYERQIALPEVGESGQRRLQAARVLVIGMGGLGSPLAFYLAGAGIGTMGIFDPDRVSESNLQRQILYRTVDVGRFKVEAATDRLKELNPFLRINVYRKAFGAGHAALVKGYDCVVDATDNMMVRMELAAACHHYRVPYIYGGVERFRGLVLTVIPGRSCCFRCLQESLAPGDSGPVVGPLGFVPGVIGCIQAGEVIRLVLGKGDLLVDRLLILDARRMGFREVAVHRNPDCPLCGKQAGRGTPAERKKKGKR